MVMPYQEPTIESEARRLGMTVEQYVYTMMLKEYGTGTPRADLTAAYNQPAYTPPPAPPAGGESSYPPAAAAYAPTTRGEPSYQPAASAYNPPTPAAAQPPQEPYEYRETSGLGKVGTQIGKDIEHYSAKQIRGQVERTQRAHAEELQKYNSLPDGILKDLSHKNLLMLEEQWDQLAVSIQTGFSAPRALGTLFENPSLLPLWGQLKSETEGGMAYELPPLVGRLTPSKIGGPTGVEPPSAVSLPPGVGQLDYSSDLATSLIPGIDAQPTYKGGQFGGVAPAGAGQTFMGGQFGGPVAGKSAAAPAAGGMWPQVRSAEGMVTPGRGFADYTTMAAATAQRDVDMGLDKRWRPGSVYQPWEMQAIVKSETGKDMGSPAALRTYLGADEGQPAITGAVNVQRVDLGQGEQDYIVRRDGMGNILSYTPA